MKKDFCKAVKPPENIKTLEFNQNKKSDEATFIIYADLECQIEKMDRCKNNLATLSTTKAGEHIPSGFSVSTISSFKYIENKHDAYRGKDCMKKFCESLRELLKMINFKNKKMKLLTREPQESYENGKICYICKE